MDDLEKLRDEVLRAIGRNVLNLQKMEAMLKSLVLGVQSSIPIETEQKLIKSTKKRKKAISKMPFGRLVDDFVRSVHPNHGGTEEQPAQPEAATISSSFKFEDGEFVDDLKASLRIVVKERNALIHKKLASFDPNSPEACRELAKELEDQRQRIRPQFEALKAIWLGMREHQQELLKYINSAEFEEAFRKVIEGQKETSH